MVTYGAAILTSPRMDFCLTLFMVRSIRLNQIKTETPIPAVLRSALAKWVLTGSADLMVRLCAAFVGRAGGINPRGKNYWSIVWHSLAARLQKFEIRLSPGRPRLTNSPS